LASVTPPALPIQRPWARAGPVDVTLATGEEKPSPLFFGPGAV
jgi:hypothetical protein